MKNEMMQKAANALTKFSAKAKAHSPEILLIAGIAGVVGTVVLACAGTRKLDAVLEDSKQRIDEAKETVVENEDGQTTSGSQKALVKAYAQTSLDFAKIYGPAVMLGGLSIYCLLSSHRIMRDRNESLAAAYTTVYTAFKQYQRNNKSELVWSFLWRACGADCRGAVQRFDKQTYLDRQRWAQATKKRFLSSQGGKF